MAIMLLQLTTMTIKIMIALLCKMCDRYGHAFTVPVVAVTYMTHTDCCD